VAPASVVCSAGAGYGRRRHLSRNASGDFPLSIPQPLQSTTPVLGETPATDKAFQSPLNCEKIRHMKNERKIQALGIRQQRFLQRYILEIEATVSSCDPLYHVVALVTSERNHGVRIHFFNNDLDGTALNGIVYKAIISHSSRENFPGNESTPALMAKLEEIS
jgi:hypothetical protein